jgi:hypothetical protein
MPFNSAAAHTVRIAKTLSAVVLGATFLLVPSASQAAQSKDFSYVAMVSAGANSWAALNNSGSGFELVRIDPTSGAITKSLILAGVPKGSIFGGMAITSSTLAVLDIKNGVSGGVFSAHDEVSLLNATTGALEHSINCGGRDLSCSSVAASANNVFFVETSNSSNDPYEIHVVNATTGASVDTVSVKHVKAADLDVTSTPTDVYFLSAAQGPETLTEISGVSGHPVRTVTTSLKGFPSTFAVVGNQLWIPATKKGDALSANVPTVQRKDSIDALVELDATTGKVETTVSGSIYNFPSASTAAGTWFGANFTASSQHLWVDSPTTTALTEIDPQNGRLLRNISLGNGALAHAGGVLADDGTDVLVATATGIKEFNDTTGVLIHTIR